MMQPAHDPAGSGLFLSLGVGMIAVFLGLRQWYESSARDRELPVKDRSHFRSQDVRRWAGVILLLLLAIEIWAGSRIPYRDENRPSRMFLLIWLAVGIELVVLLALAMVDLLQTRRYARRQHRSLLLERIRLSRSVRSNPAGEQTPTSHQPLPPDKLTD